MERDPHEPEPDAERARSAEPEPAEPSGPEAPVEEHAFGPDPTDDVADEEQAAAAEAGAIGGEVGEEEDPADRPVVEAGGGVAEGFEQAEEHLREHAEHGGDFRRPTRDALAPEEEADRASAAYGDPDRVDPPEPDVTSRDDV